MSETHTFQIYRSRIEYLEQHLQLIDIALTKLAQTTKQQRHAGKTILQVLQITGDRHQRLNHPISNTPRLCNFSRRRNIELAFQSLYHHFAEYMRGILRELYDHDPKMIVGKAPNCLQFHEIVELATYEKVVERMIDDVFRRLQSERSDLKLLDKVLLHTGVHLTDAAKSQGLAYLGIRHLIVHNQGKADQKFSQDYGAIIPTLVGQPLPMQFRTAADAITAVNNLITEIDTQLIQRGLVTPRG